MKARFVRALGALACLATFSLVGVAAAQPSAPTDTADSMFREGKKAMEAGDYARACPLFEESQRLDPAGGTLMNLGLCLEKAGRVASAERAYLSAATRARADGRADRLGEAHAHLAALGPRVPTVVLVLSPGRGAPSRVSIDGQKIDDLVEPVRLDPGAHTARIERDGAAPSTRAFDLREGEHKKLAIDDEASPALPAPAPPNAAPPSTAAPPAPEGFTPKAYVLTTKPGSVAPSPDESQAHPRASFSAASWASLGVSLAGFGVAGITGLMAVSARSTYTSTCIDARAYCTDTEALAAGERARDLAWVSTIAVGVGFGALWTALLLPRSFPVAPSPAGAGLAVRSTF